MSSRPHILIIDDVIENVGVLGDTLADLAEVQFATSGREGIMLAQSTPPDLILLDVMMPDMDGFQVLEALKTDKRTAAIPVLFVTARTDVETESRALIRGAVDFIQKPIRAEAVRSRVQLHLTLHRQTAELKALNTSLEARIEQRSRELVDALRRAEGSSRTKSSFLARVSHELRTPLNSVIGLAQVGLRDAAAGLPVETHYARILAAGQQLLGVVNDVIDFSRLEDGQLSVDSKAVDLASTVAQAVQKVEPAAAAKGLSMQVTWGASRGLVVVGDARRIEQVLVHLLSNAVKFTAAGHVHLDVHETPAQVIFDVSDTGIGMSSSQLESLFQPFEQVDGSSTRPYSGLGLGLVISRHLAQEMGGTVEVKSLPGEGTEVRFTLTRVAQVATAPPQAAPAASLGRLQGLRLLAVEDIEVNRFLLTRIFEQEGASFQFEENGRDAIEAVSEATRSDASQRAFDAVLMDIQMPLMDGYEATRRIHALSPGLPVIGLTAHCLPEDRAKSLASGMAAHLSKPVDVDELVGAVLRACGRAVPDWRGRTPTPQEPLSDDRQPTARTAPGSSPGRASTGHVWLPVAGAAASIDWEALAVSLGMGDAFILQLAQAVVRNLEGKPAVLRAAADDADHATLRREAHAIKGIAGNIKAQAAFALARETELASKDMRLEAASLARDLALDVEAMVAAARARLAA